MKMENKDTGLGGCGCLMAGLVFDLFKLIYFCIYGFPEGWSLGTFLLVSLGGLLLLGFVWIIIQVVAGRREKREKDDDVS